MLSLARLLYPFGDRRLAQPAGTISVFGCTFSPSSCSSPPPRPVTDPLSPGVVIAGGCMPDWERVCARPGGWRVSGGWVIHGWLCAWRSWNCFGAAGGRGDSLCIHCAVPGELQLRFLGCVGELPCKWRTNFLVPAWVFALVFLHAVRNYRSKRCNSCGTDQNND